mmetsp:Transcript_29791/g.91404  ORF Transcript_29791/g.91404 Transcript_29791/m.91404 type:complete len:218 (+) Transcript_29791:1953-2606(+)
MRLSFSRPPPQPPPNPTPADSSALPVILFSLVTCWVLPLLFYLLSNGRKSSEKEDIDLVGLGYCSEPITGVSEDALWDAMVEKIKRPDKFLPVTEVSTVDKQSQSGPFVRRSMKFIGPGPLNGTAITENIYQDKSTGEIRFVILDASDKETDDEIVNAMHRNPIRIEYFKRTVHKKERVHFKAPTAGVVKSIATTVEMAKVAGTPQNLPRPAMSPRR